MVFWIVIGGAIAALFVAVILLAMRDFPPPAETSAEPAVQQTAPEAPRPSQ